MTPITITVTNTECKINTMLDINRLSVLQNLCSFEPEGNEYMSNEIRKKNGGNWDGVMRLFNINSQTFPYGLLTKVLDLFNNANQPYELIDNRTQSETRFEMPFGCHADTHRDYQFSAMNASLMNKCGIVQSATGSGKTTIAAMTIQKLCRNTVFIVHTKDLLYQTFDSFKYLFGGSSKLGIIGDGMFDPNLITIATVQTLSKLTNKNIYEKYQMDEDYNDEEGKQEKDIIVTKEISKKCYDWIHGIDVVMFDEVQRVASRTAYTARYMFNNADFAFGYSASPWRNDGADLMIEAAFGPKICEISASELIEKGYLMQPTIEIRHLQHNIWSGKTYNQVYASAIVNNFMRNMDVISDAMRHYNNGLNTLILITQIKHGKILLEMLKINGIDAKMISGKSNMKYRKEVLDNMRNGTEQLVIASTIADVGIDIPRLEAIVEAGAGKSSVTALQRLGRIMRKHPDKTECIFTTYRDNSPYINRHIDSKIKIWSQEPKFIIKEI